MPRRLGQIQSAPSDDGGGGFAFIRELHGRDGEFDQEASFDSREN
jgi:hypothetical protein